MHADDRDAIECARAGDVVALAGLHSIRTGHTLCDKNSPLLLEDISAYSPVISRALEPANSEEAKKLDEALKHYLLEDPTLKLVLDEDTGQRILSGMGELHLDVVLERLKREYHLSPRSGEPRVIYKETVSQPAQGHAKVEREVGGLMHEGEVCLKVEPLGRGEANFIELPEVSSSGQAKITSAEQVIRESLKLAIESALTSGPANGYEVADVRVTVTGYSSKSGAGLAMAASQALKDALQNGSAVVLEPIMRVEIVSPTESIGDVLNLLATCNGRVINVMPGEQVEEIKAEASMRNLFGFATSLRSVSKGRAGMTLAFDRFDVSQ
jgi:Translation elongation factors (GTPases)